MKYKILVFALVSSILSHSQYTEVINSKRPGFSESPFAIGTGVYQLEGGFFYQKNNRPDFFTARKTLGVDLFLRSGLFWERFEVSTNFKYQKDEILRNLVTGETQPISGISQFTIGAKSLIYMPKYKDPSKEIRSWKKKVAFDWKRLIPSVGVYAGFNTNALSTDYQATTFSPKAAILLQNDFTTDLVLITNIVGDHLTIQDKRKFGYIATLTYSFTPRFSSFIEHQGMYTRYTKIYEIGGGFAYLLNKDIQIGLNLRTDHQMDYLNIYGGLGLSYRIDRHKDKIIMLKQNDEGSGKIKNRRGGFFSRLFSKKLRRGKMPREKKYKKRRKRKRRG